MNKQSKRAIGMAMVAAFALGGVAGPVSPASAKTIKICVKKKTGEMRMAKKCKKGWKKVSWNSVGPIGPVGPAGPQLKVVDKNGVVLGDFWGFNFLSFMPYFNVGYQGGGYVYMSDGRLVPFGASPKFRDATCLGTPYINPNAVDLPIYLSTVGGPGRLVYRATNPVWQAAKSYKLTSTLQSHSGATWMLDDSGNCVPSPVFTGTMVQLEAVPAPPDATGPLTLR